MSAALEPLRVYPETVKGQLHAVAMATVVEDVVKDQKDRLRGLLEGEVRRLSEETGAAFTARVGGIGSAVLTDPQPKASVADGQVFGAWLYEQMPPDAGLVEACDRVEVTDHEEVAAALRSLDGSAPHDQVDQIAARAARVMHGSLRIVTEYFPSEDALDVLLAKSWAAIVQTADGWSLVEVDGDGVIGDEIPGVRVSCAKQVLQVKLDSAARKQAKAEVREALGLPEIGGGS